MGSRSSAPIPNPHNFSDDEWEIDLFQTQDLTDSDFGFLKILKHKMTEFVVAKYELSFSSIKDFEYYLESYKWRLDEPYIVKTYYLNPKRDDSFCGKSYGGELYIQHPKNRLSDFKDIPHPDNLYCLEATLRGYQKLFRISGGFPISEEQVCIDQAGNITVWFNKDLSKNYPEDYPIAERPRKIKVQQNDIVEEIVSMIIQNTDPECDPEVSFSQFYKMNKISGQLGFPEALKLLYDYTQAANCLIPDHFTSVADMYKNNVSESLIEGHIVLNGSQLDDLQWHGDIRTTNQAQEKTNSNHGPHSQNKSVIGEDRNREEKIQSKDGKDNMNIHQNNSNNSSRVSLARPSSKKTNQQFQPKNEQIFFQSARIFQQNRENSGIRPSNDEAPLCYSQISNQRPISKSNIPYRQSVSSPLFTLNPPTIRTQSDNLTQMSLLRASGHDERQRSNICQPFTPFFDKSLEKKVSQEGQSANPKKMIEILYSDGRKQKPTGQVQFRFAFQSPPDRKENHQTFTNSLTNQSNHQTLPGKSSNGSHFFSGDGNRQSTEPSGPREKSPESPQSPPSLPSPDIKNFNSPEASMKNDEQKQLCQNYEEEKKESWETHLQLYSYYDTIRESVQLDPEIARDLALYT